jgi:hypothetical protein
MKDKENTQKVVETFIDFCKSKGYQCKTAETEHCIRLDVSNSKDKANLNFYYTGKIVPQGGESSLKQELIELKARWETDPSLFITGVSLKTRACNTTYMIMLPDLRKKIKGVIAEYDNAEVIDNPKADTEYRAKITDGTSLLTITQFSNGTLWLQGKEGSVFDSFCSSVEKIASPSDKEIISRFISSDKDKVDLFASRYTPELLSNAEKNVRGRLSDVYDYLETQDRKYFVASECLILSELILPEYSACVMPASKGFEGFAKKLLIGIGLFDRDYFKNKKANFGFLNDKTNPKRKAICDKSKYNESYLDKLSNSLDFCRNFMMHSDDSQVTKVENRDEAIEKVNFIQKETKDIFEYFKSIYGLNP